MCSENIKLNICRCKISINEIKYLGHWFSEKGISVDESKVKAIAEMPPPTDKKSLERCLGVITYLSKFIPSVLELTSPLRAILKNDVACQWSFEQQ